MNSHEITSFQKTLLGAAFVAGPALLCASTTSFALGIGLIPPGVSSWVEGIFGSLGIACFVPIYLELSRRVGRSHPRLGALTSVTGLFGATVGVALEFLRVAEHAFRSNGAADGVFAATYSNPGWEFLSVALLGPLFPLTSILLGVGAFAGRTMPRGVAACLVAAGVGFPLAQVAGLELALRFTYPAAGVLWLIALAPLGVAYFREAASERRNAPGATPVQRRNARWNVLASE
ncbi:MAG: hypothetical protein HS104_09915 [Polyangiaceae bacterium]|nr:hypothetical protein [Polyangiaceae bacterium]MCE7894874.1 hypothetical protein [Sorangiineae bacterium PRO1]MCL4750856.1 hypothetical protein [Myxococcales bacterium]